MYFKSFACIGPFGILTPDMPIDFNAKLSVTPALCKEPDYRHWIAPMQLRRMSKPVRMGIAAARMCLLPEEKADPASVHTGTAYGMLADTETFLNNLVSRDEMMLTPTSFIQSTHNTVGGQIALALECNAHNMTFVQGGHSFESAVLDAILWTGGFQDKPSLLGAVEELTPTSFDILSRLNVYNSRVVAGEGASFFQVSGSKDQGYIARLAAMEMFRRRRRGKQVSALFSDFLHHHKLTISDQDICLLGDVNPGIAAYESLNRLFPAGNIITFKDYCGEYPTASAFALGLALSLQQNNRTGKTWIINHYGNYWSFWCIAD